MEDTLTITPTGFTPFNGLVGPLNRVTPFTHRDNATFLRILQDLVRYINETFNGEVTTEMQRILTEFNTILTSQKTDFDAVKADWDTKFSLNNDELEKQITLLNNESVNGMVATDGNIVKATIMGLISAATDALHTTVSGEVAAVDTKTADNGFLFACFTANGTAGEKLNTFYSPDGKTVFGGQGNPAYTPVDGQGLRDPSLLYYGGKWYVAYTSNNGIDKDFHIAVSDTGAPGTWTLHTTVDASMIPALEQSWAPEFVQGDDGIYIFFTKVANSKGSMYWVKANNTNLTAFTPPQPVNFTTFPNNWIDGVPVKKEGKWYLFYGVGDAIERAVSDTLTGTYTTDRTGNWNGWGSGIEGPIMVKDGNIWRAYFDRYVAGTGYWWSESTDLDTWTTPQQLKTAPGVLGAGQVLRHGGMYKLGPAERNKIVAGQGMGTAQPRHLEIYALNKDVPKGTDTTVTGWQVDANETTDASIASYDPASGVVTLNVTGGIYRFTINVGAPDYTQGVNNVTRSFIQYGMPEGPQTIFLRQSGGVEDIFGLTVPNHHAKAGERIRFQIFCDWTGTATSAAMSPRLKITLDS